MKTIGLIGGMSWESSRLYYELINKKVKTVLGGFHSAKSVLISVDFDEITKLQSKNDWESLNQMMVKAARQLENAGADMVLVCANTMHLCSEAIIKNSSLPFLHIAEATGEVIKENSLKKVALLGTKFTMEKDFYKDILTNDFGIEVLIPDIKSRDLVHDIIYKELVLGKIKDTSKEIYLKIINDLISQGAEGVILGCTEIPLLISGEDVTVPIFNTAKIHAEKAVQFALKKH
jgi:aspartate racemase